MVRGVEGRLLSFEQHVSLLHGLLPVQSGHDYNLRSRPHNIFLSCRRNFIRTLAFKNTYYYPNPLSPLRNIVFIQHPITIHSSVIDIKRYFTFKLTFFTALSLSHYISALRQSCVLSTLVLINEYECHSICFLTWQCPSGPINKRIRMCLSCLSVAYSY